MQAILVLLAMLVTQEQMAPQEPVVLVVQLGHLVIPAHQEMLAQTVLAELAVLVVLQGMPAIREPQEMQVRMVLAELAVLVVLQGMLERQETLVILVPMVPAVLAVQEEMLGIQVPQETLEIQEIMVPAVLVALAVAQVREEAADKVQPDLAVAEPVAVVVRAVAAVVLAPHLRLVLPPAAPEALLAEEMVALVEAQILGGAFAAAAVAAAEAAVAE